MKKLRKCLCLLVTLTTLTLCLFACSNGGDPAHTSPSVSPPAGDESKASESSNKTNLALSDIKIGAVSTNSAQDGGWTQSHFDSLKVAQQNLGLTDDQLILVEKVAQSGPDGQNVMEQLVEEGCNIIIGCTSNLRESTTTVAKNNPDVIFYQFGGETLDNLVNYNIRDYQTIFLLGYLSAHMSDGDELGFVAAMPELSVVRAINSYAIGARYANSNATVRVAWVNNWYDPASEKEAAVSLLESGLNVLGYHGSTSSVMQTCEEYGAYATGFHIDMKSYAPKAVMTSFIWNWAPIFEDAVLSLVDGTWTNDVVFLGIERGCASLAPYNTDIVPVDVINELEDIEKKLLSGEIEVFGGELKDNEGNIIVPAGEVMGDEQLLTAMYLASNVIGKLP